MNVFSKGDIIRNKETGCDYEVSSVCGEEEIVIIPFPTDGECEFEFGKADGFVLVMPKLVRDQFIRLEELVSKLTENLH